MTTGVTLDAGALIALDRARPGVVSYLDDLVALGGTVEVPTTALAQVVREPTRQARLMRLLRRSTTQTRPLGREDAVAVGLLLARAGMADVADAHVVLCARRTGTAVMTSDVDDLRRLDASIELIRV